MFCKSSDDSLFVLKFSGIMWVNIYVLSYEIICLKFFCKFYYDLCMFFSFFIIESSYLFIFIL